MPVLFGLMELKSELVKQLQRFGIIGMPRCGEQQKGREADLRRCRIAVAARPGELTLASEEISAKYAFTAIAFALSDRPLDEVPLDL